MVKQKLGEKTEQYCRKIPLQSLARPHMLEKLRANVVTLCTHVREITVRTQVFVNWYILTRLEAGQDVPNYIYSQNSFLQHMPASYWQEHYKYEHKNAT